MARQCQHRRTRRIYSEALTFENLMGAWHTVLHTCQNKRGLYEFAMFEQARVMKLLETLQRREYWPNKYRCFMIFEPKPRLVMSQSINDKTVNHFVAKHYLLPLLERTLIDTNVATRKDKGAKYAKKMIQRYISQMEAKSPGAPIYALKVDVSKYFYTIDHEILFKMLERRIKDRDIIEILRRIVGETNRPYINAVVDGFNHYYGTDIPHYQHNKGLSIGAMTSQFLAIYYLNDVDHLLKEREGCQYYIRYMDDLLIFGHDAGELKWVWQVVEEEFAKLKLTVNPKSAIYNVTSSAGVPFLGYRYYVDEKRRLRVRCLAHTMRRVRRRLSVLKNKDVEKYERSKASYKGYFMNELRARGLERWAKM